MVLSSWIYVGTTVEGVRGKKQSPLMHSSLWKYVMFEKLWTIQKDENMHILTVIVKKGNKETIYGVPALTFPTYCFPVPVHSSKRKKLFHIHPRLVRCRVRPSRSDVLIPGTGRISAPLHPSKQNNRRKVSWLIIIVSDHSWRVLDKESIKKQSSAVKILLNGRSEEMGHLILNSPKFCLLGACDG